MSDQELMKEFLKVIHSRAVVVGGVNSNGNSSDFSLGYLESFVSDHMTPKFRKAIRDRMATYKNMEA